VYNRDTTREKFRSIKKRGFNKQGRDIDEKGFVFAGFFVCFLQFRSKGKGRF
jgi:hypothetical protein